MAKDSETKRRVDEINLEAARLYSSEDGNWLKSSMKALQMSENIEYWYGAACALRNIGAYYLIHGANYDKALEHYIRGYYKVMLALNQNKEKDKKDVLIHEAYYQAFQISNLFGKLDMPNKELEYNLIAEKYLLESKHKDSSDLILIKVSKAFIMKKLKLHSEAISILEESITYFQSKENQSNQETLGILVDLYCNIAGAFLTLGNYDRALENSDKAVDIAQKVEVSILKSSAYFTKGMALIDKGLYREALVNSDTAETKAKTRIDSLLFLTTRGKAYYHLKKYRRAKEILETAFHWYLERKDNKKQINETATMLKSIYQVLDNRAEIAKIDSLIRNFEKTSAALKHAYIKKKYTELIAEQERYIERRKGFKKKALRYTVALSISLLCSGMLFFRIVFGKSSWLIS